MPEVDLGMVESSNDAPAAPQVHEGREIGMVGSNNSSDDQEDKGRVDEGDHRSLGGNRWPRQETLALLKIRSDMDAVFRDSSLKGPLWEEISRKLAELGYNRSAKKCREKFENVCKYHKRTKDVRTGKPDGKTYRFFDQIQALENVHSLKSLSPPKPQTPTPTTMTTASFHVPSTTPAPSSMNPMTFSQAVPVHSINPNNPNNYMHTSSDFRNVSSNLFSTSTSSYSTASDGVHDTEHHQGRRSSTEKKNVKKRKKRKWKEFFMRLTREAIEKQVELQNKFLQTIERIENKRMAKEDGWRVQEMSRINRDHEVLVQERSSAAAKDAAFIAWLQKISGSQVQVQNIINPQPPATEVLSLPPLQQTKLNNVVSSSTRWPKDEIEALIKIRTGLEVKYQEINGPNKGPLWEEISAEMRKLGYNRNAKRCKEKWENINKYFKRVKERSKKRPEDSKTCPYFHQLDAIYKEKMLMMSSKNEDGSMMPLMIRPEQQWRPPLIPQQEITMQKNDEDEDEDEDDDDENDDFELVGNKSTATIGSGAE